MAKLRIASIVFLAALSGASQVQGVAAYPTKLVRLIVPLAAGAGMDTVARGVALKLTENLGQTVVVDNRGGGGGSIDAELAASSLPDGYTLIMMSATLVIHPQMYKARYDILRDFTPVSQVTTQPYVIVVNPALPVKAVGDLVAYAKADPAKLNFASSGNGSLIHLTGARRAKAAPELPTAAETGVKGFAVSNWYGIQVPARTDGPG